MGFAFRNTFSISKQARALSNIGFGMRENLCHPSKKKYCTPKVKAALEKNKLQVVEGTNRSLSDEDLEERVCKINLICNIEENIYVINIFQNQYQLP